MAEKNETEPEVQQADVAPAGGKKKKKKTGWIIAIIVVVLIIVIAVIASSSGSSYDYSSPSAVVSADEIISAYVDNTAAADEEYKDNVVAVTGKIRSIEDTYANMDAYDDDYWIYSLCVYMEDDEDLKSFVKGDTITVVGICDSTDIVGNVELKNSRIDESFAVIPDYDSAEVISAADLVDVYTANQVSADETYKGKVLEVTGKVISVNDNYISVYPDDDSYWDGIEVYFEDDADLASIEENSEITIIGECFGGSDLYAARICRAIIK